MEITYVIRARNPLDMEGSPDVFAVFADEELAEETVEQLNAEAQAAAIKVWGERWYKFAIEYELEKWPVSISVKEVINKLRDEDI